MKINTKNRLLCTLLAAASATSAYAADITNTGNITNTGAVTNTGTITNNGTVFVQAPDAPPVSTGTAPEPSSPIGNAQNKGFTTTTDPSLIYTYSTNGSGLQTQVQLTNGGVIAETNGNLTLQQEITQTDTASYSIESRELKVSDPDGFTDALGTYGPIGQFYQNGTSIPNTAVLIATVRDENGKLLSVVSDLVDPDTLLPVGPVAAVDGNGNPILTPAQIASALASGDAPAGFLVAGTPVTTPDTGGLTVEGATSTNGIDNNGAKITNIATGTAATDAANVGNVTTAIDAAITTEAKTRGDADKVLTDAGAAEAKTRADADKVLTDAGAAEAKTRADADKVLTDADTKLTTDLGTEVTNRTKADTALEDKIDTKMVAAAAETSKVISKKTNGAIHIGENSLITQEVGGVQELYAQDVNGGPIDINIANGSDLKINGQSVATRSEYQAADRGLSNRIDKNTRGIAMVAAMTNSTIEAGKNHAVDFNAATFDGESGFAFGYAQRVNENVQLHGAASTTSDCEESAVRLGVSIQW